MADIMDNNLRTSKKALVFDDDEDLLTIFRFLFEDRGWEVYTCDNCDQVIARTLEMMPDLILMDNWIPTIGGIAATRLLKNHESLKTIPVIYISANNNITELCEQAGADACMAKPFELEKLHQLAEELTRETKMSYLS